MAGPRRKKTSSFHACRYDELDVGTPIMSHTETLERVPNSDVDRVRQDFLDAGAPTVTVTVNGDGQSKVFAIFPDLGHRSGGFPRGTARDFRLARAWGPLGVANE